MTLTALNNVLRQQSATTRALGLALSMAAMAGCSRPAGPAETVAAATANIAPVPVSTELLPGMPPLLDPRNIYAAGRPGNLSAVVAAFPSRIYVPNTVSNTVDVIDPTSFTVIDH